MPDEINLPADTAAASAPALTPVPAIAPVFVAAPVENIYDLFATDQAAEKVGKWLDYGKAGFLVARSGGTNEAYTNALAKVMRPHARRLKLGQITPKEANAIVLPVFVRHCLLNWRNVNVAGPVDSATGKKTSVPLPYSFDNAVKLLTDIPDLYANLLEDAGAIATFAPEDVEDIAGN